MCSFDVDAANVVNLTTPEGLESAGLSEADLTERWIGRGDAATQQAARDLSAEGLDGFLYPSLQHPSGRNLVLWRLEGTAHVRLLDRMGEAVMRPMK